MSLENPDLKPPRKPRRFGRKLLFWTIISVGALAGSLYSCSFIRDGLVYMYPPSQPILNEVEKLIGGWYSFKPKPVKHVEKTEESLPFLSKPVEEPEKPLLPTFEEVKEMIEHRADSLSSELVELSNLPKMISDARLKVDRATSKLKELESVMQKYVEALRHAVQDVDSSTKQKSWDAVIKLEALKTKTEENVESYVQKANELLSEVKHAIDQHKGTEQALNSEILPESIISLGRLQYILSGALNEIRKLRSDEVMLKRYRDLVSATHQSLEEDFNTLLKSVDLSSSPKKGAKMTVEELNNLISVAHNRIASLQTKLQQVEKQEKERLKSALDAQRHEDELLMSEVVIRELELERSKHELERHKWMIGTREAIDRELRQALTRHSEHLAEMLKLEREKMEHQFSFTLREALTKEKVAFQAALSGWIKRMQAIEDVVDGRAELDLLAKELQTLWLACEAFSGRLNSSMPVTAGDPNSVTLRTGSLKEFVNYIREAASTGNHPFALKILEQIPQEAVENGVWMESGLRERFEKVYKVCRRVALIDETSASLWTYLLSYLQSVLIWDMKDRCLAALSIINPNAKSANARLLTGDSHLDPDGHLDTFCLLSSAKVALAVNNKTNTNLLLDQAASSSNGDQNDLVISPDGIELAVRLLGQLRGQARVVADDWIRDARLYLETRQTAQTLLAYASARNISVHQKRL